MNPVCITRIATATPPHDIHAAFLNYAEGMLDEPRMKMLLRHMAGRSGIEHRYSYIQTEPARGEDTLDGNKLFQRGAFPSTEERMKIFERFAPVLLREALDRLALTEEERSSIRHVIVTCCTGLYAPGLDFVAMEYLNLSPGTERTMIGFMGCYAAINGLKLARHIVRSEREAGVLLINLELCSLHFQETQNIEQILSFLLFGDGCAVSLIRAADHGLELDGFEAFTIPNAKDLIRWRIGESGFDMTLSGQVPIELCRFLSAHRAEIDPDASTELWAVHPGGRSVLDAVEKGLQSKEKLTASRSILSRFGNMSSATIMFVLAELMRDARRGLCGRAMAFGPGLTAETMRFRVL